ncbi:MAG: cupin domain-containing protein [Candidatus Rokubacteria bacterium]|nr:cupin domain-containing protein [Candidatus Rokubacteria bacterium]
MKRGNLFANLPGPRPGELVEVLLDCPGLTLERIISTGQATPPGRWWDQAGDEWVVLLRGSAALRVEGKPDLLVLGPGDWVEIPARCRHRVEWTDPAGPTVWLALHHASLSREGEKAG